MDDSVKYEREGAKDAIIDINVFKKHGFNIIDLSVW